jgi:hypothetical protein
MLFSNTLNPRVHVYLLVWMQLLEKINCNGSVVPSQVVGGIHLVTVVVSLTDRALLIFCIILKFPITLFTSNFFNNRVPRLFNIDNESLYFLFSYQILKLFLIEIFVARFCYQNWRFLIGFT